MKYMTCEEVGSIMNGIAEMNALKCLADMNSTATRYEEQLNLRYRWRDA